MKASKFSEAQIAFVLKQAEGGTPVGEVCRKARISDANRLQLAQKIRGPDAVRNEVVAADRGTERQAEAGLKKTIKDQHGVSIREFLSAKAEF